MNSLQKSLLKSKLPMGLPPTSASAMSMAKTGRKVGLGRKRDYTPIHWSQYFTTSEDVVVNEEGDTFRVYRRGSSGPLLLLLHGGGFSALTWALFSSCVHSLVDCEVMAIDLRGHGDTKTKKEDDLSAETTANDVVGVLRAVFGDEPPPVVLIGHSMGGAIAVHTAATNLIPTLAGLIVIDVVEGTAMEALASMQSFLRSRPRNFISLETAIEWSVRSGQIRNAESARVSVPGQLASMATGKCATSEVSLSTPSSPQASAAPSAPQVHGECITEEDEESAEKSSPLEEFKAPSAAYRWRIDLTQTEKHWPGWFHGLSATFLSVPTAKLLLLAGIDRLDKELTVGQMQGKFQMQVLPQCGHAVHEDVPDKVAEVVSTFLIRNRLATAKDNFTWVMPSC